MAPPVVSLTSPAVALSPTDVELLATRAKALGDPVRLRIFAQIAGAPAGEVCVCDVVGPAGRSQATVSHHLRLLREAGLIVGERRGTWVWYRADADNVAAFQAQLAAVATGRQPMALATAADSA